MTITEISGNPTCGIIAGMPSVIGVTYKPQQSKLRTSQKITPQCSRRAKASEKANGPTPRMPRNGEDQDAFSELQKEDKNDEHTCIKAAHEEQHWHLRASNMRYHRQCDRCVCWSLAEPQKLKQRQNISFIKVSLCIRHKVILIGSLQTKDVKQSCNIDRTQCSARLASSKR